MTNPITGALNSGLGLLDDIDVQVSVELGGTSMALRDVFAMAEDQVIMLDRLVDEPLDLLVNGKPVARGEVVAEGNRFGLKILELVGQDTAPAPAPNAGAANAGAAAAPENERRAGLPIVEQT